MLHKDSHECLKSELDLFTVPLTQATIESGQWVEHTPVSTLGSNAPIEFHVTTADEYLDLGETLLYVQVRLLRANGDAVATTNKVGP